jgi:hypothetical protein
MLNLKLASVKTHLTVSVLVISFKNTLTII